MSEPNVWVCIPTALRAHVQSTLKKWKDQGYLVALFLDPETAPVQHLTVSAMAYADLTLYSKYPGVWRAWNALAKAVMACGADVCVLAGDDMDPDPNFSAQRIAKQYLERFPDGWGIMQPTGDRQGDIINGRWNSQRICGSPWIGREWVAKAYGGHGPVCGDYTAFYADEELQIVGEKFGLLVQRDDLSQFHRHWSFGHLKQQDYHARNQKGWDSDHDLFNMRKGLDFPGVVV